MSSSCIDLPQVRISFADQPALDAQRVIVQRMIVLGGRQPSLQWLRGAAEGRLLWAVDSGAEVCMKSGITPSFALGDFDSIDETTMKWLGERGVPLEVYPSDKNFTDFQLALQKAQGDVLVTGCWGGRFDHAFSNVMSALWGLEWQANVKAFADDNEVLVPITTESSLSLFFKYPPSVVSLLPLSPECSGVKISGVKWELDSVELKQRQPYSISNTAAKEEVTITLESGVLGAYCFWDNT